MIESSIKFTIRNNILFLAETNQKSQDGQRNILNKWFQDSVKNYIFEQIACPLIGKQLQCENYVKLKDFIHSNIDKSKPKYMSIIDQYFHYIKKYNQRELFVQKLRENIQNATDVQQQCNLLKNCRAQKDIRKQFVCYLILNFFELHERCEIPSFYELWNICFPEVKQIKKKLSKFDKKKENGTETNKSVQDCQSSHSCKQSVYKRALANPKNQSEQLSQEYNFDNSSIVNPSVSFLNSLDSQNVKTIQVILKKHSDSIIYKQKKEINNGIISEDDDSEQENLANFFNENAQHQHLCFKEKSSCNLQSESEKQNKEEYDQIYEEQDQLHFCYKHYECNTSQIEKQQILDLNKQINQPINCLENQKNCISPIYIQL